MAKVYIVVVVLGLLVGAYLMGRVTGNMAGAAKCANDAALHQSQNLIQLLDTREKINAQTNHTAVRDIRRVLREKYTISD